MADNPESFRIGKPFPTDGDLAQTPNRCSKSVRSESQSEVDGCRPTLKRAASESDQNAVI